MNQAPNTTFGANPQSLLPELLEEVFTHYLPEPMVKIPISRRNVLPWRLGHVCSRWRNVALSQRRLWNYVYFECNPKKHTVMPEALEEAISRSGLGQLTFRISYSSNIIGDQDIVPDLIARYAHRCREIQFMFPDQQMKAFLENDSISFGSLEAAALKLMSSGFPILPPNYPFLQGARVFDSVSTLRKFTLQGLFSLPLNDTRLHWGQLTHVDFTTRLILPPTAHDLFIVCRNLESCRLDLTLINEGLSHSGSTAHVTGEIILPHLRHLELKCQNPSDTSYIIHPLTLPALVSFIQQFESYEFIMEESLGPLISLIRRSRCQLTHLESTRYLIRRDVTNLPDTGMETLMELRPSLTTFLGFGFMVPDSVLQRMRSGELLPSIASFKCSLNTIAACVLLVDIVEARWLNEASGGAVLEEVYAHNCVPEGLLDAVEKERIRVHEIKKRLKKEHRMVDV